MLVLLCADSAYPIIFSFLSLTLGSLELLGLLFSRVFPSILHSRKFVSQLPISNKCGIQILYVYDRAGILTFVRSESWPAPVLRNGTACGYPFII